LNFVKFHEFIFHGIPWNSMKFHQPQFPEIIWNSVKFHGKFRAIP
jgi:hypothetical protein